MACKTKCSSCWPTHHFKAQYNTFLLYTTSLALHEKKKLGCCVTTVWRCLHFLLQHVKETTQEGGRELCTTPTGWVGRLVLIGVVFRSALDTVGLLLLCLLRTFTQLLPPGNHSR